MINEWYENLYENVKKFEYSGSLLKNQNSFHEEIQFTHKAGN